MPEPINTIPRLAMFLAIIRPGKKHLIGLPWAEVAKTVWDKGTDGYTFKKSHFFAVRIRDSYMINSGTPGHIGFHCLSRQYRSVINRCCKSHGGIQHKTFLISCIRNALVASMPSVS